jgi:hypothetical protein
MGRPGVVVETSRLTLHEFVDADLDFHCRVAGDHMGDSDWARQASDRQNDPRPGLGIVSLIFFVIAVR